MDPPPRSPHLAWQNPSLPRRPMPRLYCTGLLRPELFPGIGVLSGPATASLTLVNFDLGQIYNSAKFTETSELYAVLPIAVVAGFSTGSILVAPTVNSQVLCTIKSDFLNLIHQCDVVVNGRSIE